MPRITPLLGRILKKIAPRIGATVILEPKWNVVGQITFKNGKRSYFRYSSLDLNPLGASEVSKDKDYANFFMKRMGYPIIAGSAFFSKEWCRAIGSRKNIQAAYRYAKKLGFPVMVKPNSGSQGAGVAKVYNKKELYQAMRFIFSRDKVGLVQKFIPGNDYRIVVLDQKVISAYQRTPLNLVGDGRSTVRQLLQKKQQAFVADSRDTQLNPKDFRILLKLKRQGLFMNSVLKPGGQIMLLDNANLSTGGDAHDVTKDIHPAFKKLAVRLTRDMGLKFCGVDLLIEGSITDARAKYWILETNAAPGLDHYVRSGKKQQKIVEDMYTKVLKAMEKAN